ncbi:MAG: YciI family protein, partial [Pseudomonadota bacterium]
MFYMIHGRDLAHTLEKRLAARSAHLERLEALQHQGRL